ncbi:2-dehydropantoate 2-reductase [Suhomyces tanzawaensis NRRL Y-17324]|uniref:2-dehydropantoate 2-reductase n=1 Tax=Suhomyces tanzawaensis NRRL Y-17324 TaxID=984487 RepID=A0A1E4SLZ9_9ASCO|nr:2-dehydropantoate 2-reductase [Suhomyces tanzawaensis NRRL Y-17324]ODV80543.1 2-dehydropantoate 2-reductase [Suhomyces tanzawaensis NRRL Y-17324]
MSRAYVLGAGSMGCLVAHELNQAFSRQMQPTLLLRNKNRVEEFNKANSQITVFKQNGLNVTSSKSTLTALYQPPEDTIDNLIIATKTYQTERALAPYVPHLKPTSNVLILQNGMGMASHLTNRFWPTEASRPQIFQAISTHGAYKTSPYNIHHAGQGKLSISYIPKKIEPPSHDLAQLPELVQFLVDTKPLNASYLNPQSFILVQMEKLVVNSCINPMSAIMDCFNGDLLYGTKVIPIMKRVIQEAIQVFFAEYKILEQIPEARSFLQEERLLNQVLKVCQDTRANSSSMREDVRALNQTEIDWMNGYIGKLGYKHDIPCPTNKMLVGMVKNKLSISKGVERSAADIVLDYK